MIDAQPDAAALRNQLVDALRERGALRDAAVERAFRSVPREVFVPDTPLERVYRDDAIITKTEEGVGVSSSSQPAIMAIMLQQLDLQPGLRVLEIGAGTGYNAALLRELVGDEGHVVTVDIDGEVAGWARERLDRAGYGDIEVRCADGAFGWPPGAPYDRVELTVGAPDIAPAWVEQLRDGGILVLPLTLHTAQISLALEQRGPLLVGRSVEPCGFMRIRGELAGQQLWHQFTPEFGIGTCRTDLPAARIAELLRDTPRTAPWPSDLWDFYVHVALRDDRVFTVNLTAGSMSDFAGGGFGIYLPNPPSLSVVVSRWSADDAPGSWSYGGDAAHDWLHARLTGWQQAGAPAVQDTRVSAYPRSKDAPTPPDAITIDTRWWRFVVENDGPLPRPLP